MKCVHLYNPDGRVLRLTDLEANIAVRSGLARYISKSLWRKMKGQA